MTDTEAPFGPCARGHADRRNCDGRCEAHAEGYTEGLADGSLTTHGADALARALETLNEVEACGDPALIKMFHDRVRLTYDAVKAGEKAERERIATWMHGSANHFAKDVLYAQTARILHNHAQSIQESEHHV